MNKIPQVYQSRRAFFKDLENQKLEGPMQCMFYKEFYKIDDQKQCSIIQCLGHLQIHHTKEYLTDKKCPELSVKKWDEVTDMKLYDRAIHFMHFHITEKAQLYELFMCSLVEEKMHATSGRPDDADDNTAIKHFAAICRDSYIAPVTIRKDNCKQKK